MPIITKEFLIAAHRVLKAYRNSEMLETLVWLMGSPILDSYECYKAARDYCAVYEEYEMELVKK